MYESLSHQKLSLLSLSLLSLSPLSLSLLSLSSLSLLSLSLLSLSLLSLSSLSLSSLSLFSLSLSSLPLSLFSLSLSLLSLSLSNSAFDRDTYSRVPPPANPPPLTEPAPPPPPPPRPPRSENNGVLSGGGAWIAAFFAALALWYGYLLSDVAPVETGADGFSYIRTQGGNRVLIAEDEAGRTFLVDQDANLYYDSGIEEVGWYIVAGGDGEVTNLFHDEQNGGKLSRRVVGNIRDLRQVDAEALAGFKLDGLDREEYLAGTDDATDVGTIVGFASGEDGGGDRGGGGGGDDDAEFELPPNAPLAVGTDGALKGPPVLEEGVLTLEQKKAGAKLRPRDGDRLDELVSLFDAAVESGAVGAAVGNPLAERGPGALLPGMPAEVLERAGAVAKGGK